ncbi:MAG: 50S ribosomal protein L30 [Candidatus Micrarchaeota archaeon]
MFAIVRLRGEVHTNPTVKKTMELLGLNRISHMVLKPKTAQMQAMIKNVESFTAFGEINSVTLALVLEKRGRLVGDKRLDAAFLKKKGFKSFEDLANQLIAGKTTVSKLGIKKVFRLNSPRKGFERGGIKKSFSMGGATGYRANAINDLIKRMA